MSTSTLEPPEGRLIVEFEEYRTWLFIIVHNWFSKSFKEYFYTKKKKKKN
jgi:hypothetical protein